MTNFPTRLGKKTAADLRRVLEDPDHAERQGHLVFGSSNDPLRRYCGALLSPNISAKCRAGFAEVGQAMALDAEQGRTKFIEYVAGSNVAILSDLASQLLPAAIYNRKQSHKENINEAK